MEEVAWNEDTVYSFQLSLAKDKSFVYTFPDTEKPGKLKHYYGMVCSLASRDTLNLCFGNNKVPAGLHSYLLREVSGTYLIQTFTDKRPRVFMRKYLVVSGIRVR